MRVYQIPSSVEILSDCDMIEATDYATLSVCIPPVKTFGVVLSASSFYYYDGFIWLLLSQTSGSIGNINQVTGFVSVPGDGSLSLSWTSVLNATYYKIFITSAGGSEYLAGTSFTNSFSVTGLTNNVSYAVRVVASNNNIDGQSSQIVNSTPGGSIPGQVTGLNATPSITSVYLTWNNVSGALSYNVYLTPNGSSETLYSAALTNNITVSGLNSNTSYAFRVAATSVGGQGQYSNYCNTNTLTPYPIQPTGLNATGGSNSISLIWNSSLYSSFYKIYRSSGSPNNFIYDTSATSTAFLDSNVTRGVPYFYSIVGSNSTGDSTSSTIVSAQSYTSAYVENTNAISILSFGGNFSNAQPLDGNIPAQGKTYSMRLGSLYAVSANYVDLFFGNSLSNSVSGLKYKLSTNWSSSAYSSDPTIGWVSGSVNISAADSNGYSFAYSRVNFPTTIYTGTPGSNYWPVTQIDIFVPTYTSSNNYLHSYDTTQFNAGILWSIDKDWNGVNQGYNQSNFLYFNNASGDYVSNFTTMPSTNQSLFTGSWSDPSQTNMSYLLGLRWGRSDNHQKKVIECVGDSITEGYNDNVIGVAVGGYPARLRDSIGKNSDTWEFFNFGQSGLTPEQYIATWTDWAKTTPNQATAMLYSIYSPNGFFDGNGIVLGTSRVTALQNLCIQAESLARTYGRLFIPIFITGTNTNLVTAPASAATQNNTNYVNDLLVWAQNRYVSRLLDLHSAIQDPTNNIGPSMAANYTIDGTHPNGSGYDALGALAVTAFPIAYAAALAHG